ncbi:hypothetical protein WJX73_003657 [Symbiochloris irregularis]|uniref:ABC transporter domain-containing protein n=1 Tax=Symbiochloris irregularis TaxID=706552 RepID=A0AAW1Q2F8_9CHLO
MLLTSHALNRQQPQSACHTGLQEGAAATLRASRHQQQARSSGRAVCRTAGQSAAEPQTASREDLLSNVDEAEQAHSNGVGALRHDHHYSNGALPTEPRDVGHGVRVRMQDLHKEFTTRQGTSVVVSGITTEFPPGQTVALLGPSGSGKTTLLRMIAGLEATTSGRILFDDVDATAMTVQERRVGFVFQSYALFKHMTLAENISFGPRMRGFDIDIDARVNELLELVELPGRGNAYPQQLSGGQRQRIALARALAVNPRLLLLDEPFGALDPQVRRSLRKGVKDIIARVGVTSIVVTHDQEEAFDIADRVVIFNRGKVVQEGTPEEVQNHPNSPFALYFTDVDVNRLPSTCQFMKRMGLQRQGKPFVLFRPRNVRMCDCAPQDAGARGFVPATIRDLVDLGPQQRVFLRFDDREEIEMLLVGWAAERPSQLELQQRVYVRVDPSDCMPYFPDEIASQ